MKRRRKRANKGQSWQAKAKKPKPRVSPWRVKPRDVSRQTFLKGIREKYEFLPFSKAFWDAHLIVERTSDEIKRTFLIRNRNMAAKAMAGDIGNGKRLNVTNALRTIKGGYVKEIGSRELNLLFELTRAYITKSETKNLHGKITRHIERYLKARKIPVRTENERISLQMAVDSLLLDKGISSIIESVNLPKAERDYLSNRKTYRAIDLENTTIRNTFYKEIFGRERLTSNQRKVAKRWLETHLPELEKEKAVIFKKGIRAADGSISFHNIERVYQEWVAAEDRFKKRAKEQILSQFKEKKKSHQPGKRVLRNESLKLGTRHARMAAYKPKEKTAEEKRKDMQQEAKKAELAGQRFDPVQHALNEMRKENGPSARLMAELVKRDSVKGDSVVRLFVSGSLTQKLFQKVIEDKEFQRTFGEKYADLLARGLSFIGPTGKFTAKAKKAFQGPRGGNLFRFLEKRGFVDTTHGKGNVVTYLVRI